MSLEYACIIATFEEVFEERPEHYCVRYVRHLLTVSFILNAQILPKYKNQLSLVAFRKIMMG